jgi:hypothetical protein
MEYLHQIYNSVFCINGLVAASRKPAATVNLYRGTPQDRKADETMRLGPVRMIPSAV